MGDPLYLFALGLLGAMAGFAVVQLLEQYMGWVRSKYPWPLTPPLASRLLIVPVLVLATAADVLSLGAPRDMFFAGFFTGFIAARVMDYIHWRQRRKG